MLVVYLEPHQFLCNCEKISVRPILPHMSSYYTASITIFTLLSYSSPGRNTTPTKRQENYLKRSLQLCLVNRVLIKNIGFNTSFYWMHQTDNMTISVFVPEKFDLANNNFILFSFFKLLY